MSLCLLDFYKKKILSLETTFVCFYEKKKEELPRKLAFNKQTSKLIKCCCNNDNLNT